MSGRERRMHAVWVAVAALLLVVTPAVVLAVAGVPPAPTEPEPTAAPIEQVGVDAVLVGSPASRAGTAASAAPRRAGGGEREAAAMALGAARLPAAPVWGLLVVALLGSVGLSVLTSASSGSRERDLTPDG